MILLRIKKINKLLSYLLRVSNDRGTLLKCYKYSHNPSSKYFWRKTKAVLYLMVFTEKTELFFKLEIVITKSIIDFQNAFVCIVLKFILETKSLTSNSIGEKIHGTSK